MCDGGGSTSFAIGFSGQSAGFLCVFQQDELKNAIKKKMGEVFVKKLI
jgi:hypothetical protein